MKTTELHHLGERRLRLSDVPAGLIVRLSDTELDAASRSRLRALGLTDASVIRICKQGEPCIVQVRTTRIGISERIARHVLVTAVRAPQV